MLKLIEDCEKDEIDRVGYRNVVLSRIVHIDMIINMTGDYVMITDTNALERYEIDSNAPMIDIDKLESVYNEHRTGFKLDKDNIPRMIKALEEAQRLWS